MTALPQISSAQISSAQTTSGSAGPDRDQGATPAAVSPDAEGTAVAEAAGSLRPPRRRPGEDAAPADFAALLAEPSASGDAAMPLLVPSAAPPPAARAPVRAATALPTLTAMPPASPEPPASAPPAIPLPAAVLPAAVPHATVPHAAVLPGTFPGDADGTGDAAEAIAAPPVSPAIPLPAAVLPGTVLPGTVLPGTFPGGADRTGDAAEAIAAPPVSPDDLLPAAARSPAPGSPVAAPPPSGQVLPAAPAGTTSSAISPAQEPGLTEVPAEVGPTRQVLTLAPPDGTALPPGSVMPRVQGTGPAQVTAAILPGVADPATPVRAAVAPDPAAPAPETGAADQGGASSAGSAPPPVAAPATVAIGPSPQVAPAAREGGAPRRTDAPAAIGPGRTAPTLAPAPAVTLAARTLPEASPDLSSGGAERDVFAELASLNAPGRAGTAFSAHAAAPTAPLARPAEVMGQIVAALTPGETGRVELRLDPPELGRVSVTLSGSSDALAALVTADRPETLDLLRRHADLLSRELAGAGFGGAQLSFGSPGGRAERPAPAEQAPSVAPVPAAPSPVAAAATRPTGPLDIRL